MGYHLTTSLARPPARSHASPKTHTPLPRLQERGLRFYSTELSRWVSRDPIGERGGWNLYGFVANAPSTRYDPLGLKIGAPECTLDAYLSGLGFVLAKDYTRKFVGSDYNEYEGFTATRTGEGEAVIIQQMLRSGYLFKVAGKKQHDVEKNIKDHVALRLKVISNARGLQITWGNGGYTTPPPFSSDDPAVWQAWYAANNVASTQLKCAGSTRLAFYGAIGGPAHQLSRSTEAILIPGDWYYLVNAAFDPGTGWQPGYEGENMIVVGLNGSADAILWGLMPSASERPLSDWSHDIKNVWPTQSGAQGLGDPQPFGVIRSPKNGLE
jgi:RHS repeat-associated protein